MAKRFRFIHCADLHLGTPLAIREAPSRYWEKTLREATFQAFRNIVDTAIEKRVAAIVIAGDVYNSADHSLPAQLEFSRELFRAANAGISTFIAHGNHDPVSAWQAQVPLPPTAHVFSADKVEGLPLVVENETAAMIYGRSYATMHTDGRWASDYVRGETDPYAIAVMHTQGPKAAADGPYAPLSWDEIRQSRIDYWALGHVHTREVLSEDPYVVYPGNAQSLTAAETGPRGCYLVEVGSHGTTMLEFIATDAIRSETWEFSVTDLTDVEMFIQAVLAKRQERRQEVGKPLLVTLVVNGRGALHQVFSDPAARQSILARLNEEEEMKHIFVYCRALSDQTTAAVDWQARREIPDATGDYLRAVDRLRAMSPEERHYALRQAVAARPEWERYARYFGELSDERLETALRRAEITGAQRILGDNGDEAD